MDVEISAKGVLLMPRPKTKRTPRAPRELIELAERLKQVRRRRGLSQTELGEKLGLSQRAVSDYEIGRNRIPSNVLLKIAQTLKVPLKEFVNGNGGENEARQDAPSRRILRRLQLIEKLPRRDQQKVLWMIDKTLESASNGQRAA